MSSLQIGIVGLPNVGKSTLFNALTNNDVLAANYPFATIEPNTGIVAVPDERLAKLAALYKTQKILPATTTFVDIAGLVRGASQGEGLGNLFLSHIRQCEAIVEVVRIFVDNNILHVEERIDPAKDIETINTELQLADIETVEKRLVNTRKQLKSDPKVQRTIDELEKVLSHLKSGHLLNTVHDFDEEVISDLHLLTAKPFIYLFNVSEDNLNDEVLKQNLSDLVAPARAVFVNAQLEQELQLLDPADAKELLESYGQKSSGLEKLITAAYDTLGLQSYLTAGEKEVRAWTIKKGSTAPEAAGVIHSDFEKGFIAAQIINYHDLISYGSEQAAKAAGKVRTEGRQYIMQPDDIVEFRFNV